MDPDACLFEIRLLISENRGDEIADLLKEKFENLDAWLTNGGFLPKAWNNAFERKE